MNKIVVVNGVSNETFDIGNAPINESQNLLSVIKDLFVPENKNEVCLSFEVNNNFAFWINNPMSLKRYAFMKNTLVKAELSSYKISEKMNVVEKKFNDYLLGLDLKVKSALKDELSLIADSKKPCFAGNIIEPQTENELQIKIYEALQKKGITELNELSCLVINPPFIERTTDNKTKFNFNVGNRFDVVVKTIKDKDTNEINYYLVVKETAKETEKEPIKTFNRADYNKTQGKDRKEVDEMIKQGKAILQD